MTSWLNNSARSHCIQWPVCDVITSSALGRVLSSIGPPAGRFTLSSRPHSTSVGVCNVLSRLSRVRSMRHSVRSAVGPDGRRSGGLATTSGSIGGLIAQIDQLVGHRGAVVDKVCADEGFELLAAGSVAAVVGQQAFQAGGRDAPRRPDAAGAHQHQLADAVRSVQRQPQRRGTAVGVADQVGGIDTEFVEQAADHVGQVAERVVLVDALHRAAVAGHVGHDDPEVLCQRIDVAGVVGYPGRAGAAAVQHDHGWAAAGFGDEDRFPVDGDGVFGQVGGGHADTPVLMGVMAGGAGRGRPDWLAA